MYLIDGWWPSKVPSRIVISPFWVMPPRSQFPVPGNRCSPDRMLGLERHWITFSGYLHARSTGRSISLCAYCFSRAIPSLPTRTSFSYTCVISHGSGHGPLILLRSTVRVYPCVHSCLVNCVYRALRTGAHYLSADIIRSFLMRCDALSQIGCVDIKHSSLGQFCSERFAFAFNNFFKTARPLLGAFVQQGWLVLCIFRLYL